MCCKFLLKVSMVANGATLVPGIWREDTISIAVMHPNAELVRNFNALEGNFSSE